jgi:tight adherence protein C
MTWPEDVQWLAPIVATAWVLLAGLGLWLLTVPLLDAAAPVRTDTGAEGQSVTDRLFERVGRPAARFAVFGDQGLVAGRIAAGGGSDGFTPDRFFARRAGGIVIAFVVGALLIWAEYLFIGTLAAVMIAVQADYRLRTAATRRQAEIERTLPDLLDVLSITLLAGTSFRAGLTRAAQALPGVLSDELRMLNQQMDIGVPRRRAFEQLRDRNPSPGVRRFVGGVLQAEELGHSLSDTLTDLASQMRSTGAQTARRRADATDKTISLITAALLLPALVLLVIAVFLGGLRVGG